MDRVEEEEIPHLVFLFFSPPSVESIANAMEDGTYILKILLLLPPEGDDSGQIRSLRSRAA